MIGPNFLIIGAPKAGTTTVSTWFARHPDVFMSSHKEPRYFAFSEGIPSFRGPGDAGWTSDIVTDPETYASLFAAGRDARWRGEASTDYLAWPGCANRIREYDPAMKIVVILREPVARAYSNFLFLRDRRREPETDFLAALHAEDSRRRNGWSPPFWYVGRSRYGEQLRDFLEAFGPQNVHVALFDQLRRNPGTVFEELAGFLGIAASVPPPPAQNVSTRTRSPRWAATRRTIERYVEPIKGRIPVSVRQTARRHLDRTTMYPSNPPPQAVRWVRERLADDHPVLIDLLGHDPWAVA